MNINEKLGIVPGFQWLFQLPWPYLLGVYVLLLFPILVALIFEFRLIDWRKQYSSVKEGDPALAVAIFGLFWAVDGLVADGPHWYQAVWFHVLLLVAGVLMPLYLKVQEVRETLLKKSIHREGYPYTEASTEWLNTDHKQEYPELRYGVAYSWKQHLSPTSLGHVLTNLVTVYALGVLAAAAVTRCVELLYQFVMSISVGFKPLSVSAQWQLVLPLLALSFALGVTVWCLKYWHRMTQLDNGMPRPKLTDIHPDTGWFPFRKLFSRGYDPTHPYGPTGSDSTLVDELVGQDSDGGDGVVHQPSFGWQAPREQMPPPAPVQVVHPAANGAPNRFPQDQGTRPSTLNDAVAEALDLPVAPATYGSGADRRRQGPDAAPEPQPPVVPAAQAPELVERFNAKRGDVNPVIDVTEVVPAATVAAAIRDVDGLDLFTGIPAFNPPVDDDGGLDLFQGLQQPPKVDDQGGLDLFANLPLPPTTDD